MKYSEDNLSADRVYDVASKTPLQAAPKLTKLNGNDMYLKREDMQPVHSFKIRGAYNKIAALSPHERDRGVIAASAGNHAQGVALSAQKLGLRATIVMPRTTPEIKVEAVRSYGAEVILSGDNYSEAYAACLEIIDKSGKVFIHPFDDQLVIAGQGTIGREILDQLPDVDYVFAPVGGGGLAAGVARSIKQQNPSIKIIGVEPDDSNAMQASIRAGRRLILEHVGTFADGVAVKQVGELAFELCRQYVDDYITVNNDQVCAAIKYIFEATRTIVEPAGALSLAGALAYAEDNNLTGKKLVTICSGANMSFERLQYVAERTLLGSGRELLFDITLPEKPGALAAFCQKVVNGHNITEFAYRLRDRTAAHILVGITVSGDEDSTEFIGKLRAHDYEFTDLAEDDVAKEHVRHMIGGSAAHIPAETVVEVNFPERPRALADFLDAIDTTWNISMFHYRGQGGDVGKVLIGFETDKSDELATQLDETGYDYKITDSMAVTTFL